MKIKTEQHMLVKLIHVSNIEWFREADALDCAIPVPLTR